MAKFDGLTDLLPRRDHTARHLAYNNTLDRNRIELPPSGDLAASGVVGINLDPWPHGLPVENHSASGSPSFETWINNEPIEIEMADPEDSKLVKRRFTYNANDDIATLKEALIGAPSGAPCKFSEFTYNANDDIAYINESLGTW